MTIENRIWMLAAATTALVVAAGCGSTVEPAGAGGSGGDDTTGSTSTGTGGVCAAFADQVGIASTTIRFRNESGLDVYIPAGCSSLEYEITPLTGDDGVSYVYDGSCFQSCEDLQTEEQYACGACAPIVYRLAPGETREVLWGGGGVKGAEMPGACLNTPAAGTRSCGRQVAAPAGEYRVDVAGFSACDDNGDPAGCSCDATGQCQGSTAGQEAWPDPVTFDFPASASVDVVFGVCAFGCAGGG